METAEELFHELNEETSVSNQFIEMGFIYEDGWCEKKYINIPSKISFSFSKITNEMLLTCEGKIIYSFSPSCMKALCKQAEELGWFEE